MLGFGSLRKRRPIALEIGAESIRMLQLSESFGQLVVHAAGKWQFPDTAGSDPAVRREQAIGAISEMLQSGKFQGRRVVSALPCSQLHIKNVRLPHMEAEDVARAVEWEAREHFSFDVGPDEVKFLNAGQIRQGGEARDEVILLACPREVVDDHLDLLDRVGLTPEAIDVEPVAVFRTFERFLRCGHDANAAGVIVDIEPDSTRVVAARGNTIIFAKRLDIGGRNLTEAVASQLNLSYDQAADLRMHRTSGVGDNLWHSLAEALAGGAESLAREISLCVRYCSVTFRGLRAGELTVTGQEASDDVLVGLLGDHLSIPCKVGQPLDGIDTSGVDLGCGRKYDTNEWAVCTGLALHGMDRGAEDDVDTRVSSPKALAGVEA